MTLRGFDATALIRALGQGMRQGFGMNDQATGVRGAPDALPGLTPPTPVSLVLHLSDTHFGAEDPQALEALIALVLRERPQAVVATGDITQNAATAEFAAATRFFARLACRHQLVVPGNHDLPLWNLPLRLLAPYAAFRQTFGDELEPRLRTPGLWVAGLRTTRRWRHHEGTLSQAQVLESAQWLALAPAGTLRVVALHHPVAAARDDEDDADSPAVLHGAADAVAAWADAGVHLVLGGHSHLPGFLPLARSGAVSAAEQHTGSAPMWAVQAGTAVSRHLRGRHSQAVNLLRRVGATGWRVERWSHAPEAAKFMLRDWFSITTPALAL